MTTLHRRYTDTASRSLDVSAIASARSFEQSVAAQCALAVPVRQLWHWLNGLKKRQGINFAPLFLLAIAAAALVTGGCNKKPTIDSTYGQRGWGHQASLNGTSVLAGMFEKEGFSVYSWRWLSQSLDSYQTIVWFPNDFQPPNDEQRLFFERWLADSPDRTLVYVGRDYDSTEHYWRMVLPETPPEQQMDAWYQMAEARAEHATVRLKMPVDGEFKWFSLHRDAPPVTKKELTGEWAYGVVADNTDLHIAGRLSRNTDKVVDKSPGREASTRAENLTFRPLLRYGDALLVSQLSEPSWNRSKILIINNGSFLLNLPLVNLEHRKLAGNLIRACGKPGKVAFLESEQDGPFVTSSDRSPDKISPGSRSRTILTVHWLILGLLYCLCVLPVFGRPKKGKLEEVADFGQHVRSLGDLLQKGGDYDYARTRITQYQNNAKRDSATPHSTSKHAPTKSEV